MYNLNRWLPAFDYFVWAVKTTSQGAALAAQPKDATMPVFQLFLPFWSKIISDWSPEASFCFILCLLFVCFWLNCRSVITCTVQRLMRQGKAPCEGKENIINYCYYKIVINNNHHRHNIIITICSSINMKYALMKYWAEILHCHIEF